MVFGRRELLTALFERDANGRVVRRDVSSALRSTRTRGTKLRHLISSSFLIPSNTDAIYGTEVRRILRHSLSAHLIHNNTFNATGYLLREIAKAKRDHFANDVSGDRSTMLFGPTSETMSKLNSRKRSISINSRDEEGGKGSDKPNSRRHRRLRNTAALCAQEPTTERVIVIGNNAGSLVHARIAYDPSAVEICDARCSCQRGTNTDTIVQCPAPYSNSKSPHGEALDPTLGAPAWEKRLA